MNLVEGRNLYGSAFSYVKGLCDFCKIAVFMEFNLLFC